VGQNAEDWRAKSVPIASSGQVVPSMCIHDVSRASHPCPWTMPMSMFVHVHVQVCPCSCPCDITGCPSNGRPHAKAHARAHSSAHVQHGAHMLHSAHMHGGKRRHESMRGGAAWTSNVERGRACLSAERQAQRRRVGVAAAGRGSRSEHEPVQSIPHGLCTTLPVCVCNCILPIQCEAVVV